MENQLLQTTTATTPSLNATQSTEKKKTPLNQNPKPDEKSPTFVENSCRNNNTPNPLSVPKAFKYPERYRSPTDQMVSPISKGLLARRRKMGPILPPALTPPKDQMMVKMTVDC